MKMSWIHTFFICLQWRLTCSQMLQIFLIIIPQAYWPRFEPIECVVRTCNTSIVALWTSKKGQNLSAEQSNLCFHKIWLVVPLCFQVFVDQLTSKDMEFIGDSIFPNIDKEIIAKMVEFSNRVGCLSAGAILHCQALGFFLLVSEFKRGLKAFFPASYSLSRRCVWSGGGVRKEAPGSSTCVTCSVGVSWCRPTSRRAFSTQVNM